MDLMPIDHEAMRNFAEEKTFEKNMVNEFAEAGEQMAEETAAENLIRLDFSFLMKKTGPGTVESYLDHPMNPKASKGLARVLRGFTGIAGDLDLAIIDIALGGFEMVMERKSGNAD